MTEPAVDVHRISLRKSGKADIPLVRDLLVDGFWDNVVFDMIDLHSKYPDAERFFFQCMARLEVGKYSYLILYDGQVVGHLSLVPPGATVVPKTWDLIRVAWSIPFRFGLKFTRRLVDFLSANSEQTDPHTEPLQPSTMLEWFVVKTPWRGRGIGQHVLDEFVTKHHNRVFLTTQPERSVALYQRAGFHVAAKHRLQTSYGRACTNYVMLYSAKSDSSTSRN